VRYAALYTEAFAAVLTTLVVTFFKASSDAKTATAAATDAKTTDKPSGDAKPADGKKAPEFVDVVATKKADGASATTTTAKVR
jgi:hypothetical protein